MSALKKVLAVFIGLTALVVLIHFVFSPIYADADAAIRIWFYIDPFMMAASLIAAVSLCARMRRTADARDKACHAAAFIVVATVAIWVWWNSIDLIAMGIDGEQGQSQLVIWAIIDGIFPPLMGAVAVCMWKDADAS